jgi:AcrR family transcriptional regulator
MPRPGRRQGESGTRGAIIEAARTEFLEHGYNQTTIRSIARRAEVDPALVYHYFTDKATLFLSTLNLPADPRQIVTEVLTSAISPGELLVENFLAQWETGPGRPGQSFVTMVQAMSSSPQAARSLREFLVDRVFAQMPDADEAMRWRMITVSAELFGLAWNRYVVRAEPLASTPPAEVAKRVGPALERLMFGEAVGEAVGEGLGEAVGEADNS